MEVCAGGAGVYPGGGVYGGEVIFNLEDRLCRILFLGKLTVWARCLPLLPKGWACFCGGAVRYIAGSN